jgi:hypothetical protein
MTTVTITKSDIERGVQSDCRHCPGALALTRVFPQFSFHVALNQITVHDANSGGSGDCLAVRRTPPELRSFILDFDSPLSDVVPPKPISFEIDLSEIPHRNVINPLRS